jgi:type 1 fimbria pilin
MSGSEAFQLRGTSVSATVTGHVALQDFTGTIAGQPCTITLTQNGQVVETKPVTLAADGSYAIQTAIRGNVTLQAKASHWLRRTTPSLNLTGAGLTGVDFALVNGDCDDDNEVAIGDYALLSSAFSSTPGDSNWDASADLNGDDTVDIGDYAILSGNYGLIGD